MTLEKLFQEIKENTSKMSETLVSVKNDTTTTKRLTEQQLSATKDIAENRRTEKERDKADTKGPDDTLKEILETLKDLKEGKNKSGGGGGGILGGAGNILGTAAGAALGGAGLKSLGIGIGTALVGAGVFGAGGLIPIIIPESVDEQERKTAAAPGTKEEKIEKLKEQLENLNILEKLSGVGAEIKEQIELLETGKTANHSGFGFKSGGFVYESPIKTFQQGGGVFKVPGNSTGDNHNMLLPQGSFVLNRNASNALSSANAFQIGGLVPTQLESQELVFPPGMWNGLIPALNKSIPRFQTGGIIEHIHGDPTRSGFDLKGHGLESNAHDHFAFESVELREKVQQMLSSGQTESGRSYNIGSTLRPNDTGSYHSVGKAFDVPWSQFGSGKIGEADYGQSKTLAADVKAILGTLKGPNGAKGSAAGGSGSKGSLRDFGANYAAQERALFNLTGGFNPAGPGIMPEGPSKKHNDFHKEFIPGFTSDVHSSSNSQSTFGSMMGNDPLSGEIGKVLAGDNLLAKLALLSGQVNPMTLVSGAMGGAFDGIQSAAGATPGGTGGTAPKVTKGPKGLLDFIAHYESGGDYNKIFGGQSISGLTEKTITEVVQIQQAHLNKGYESAAIGRYQMMYPEKYADKAGIGRDEKFSKENQDKMAMVYLEEDGLSKYLSGNLSADKFANNVAGTWAALPKADGQSVHAGVGSNKALVDRDTFMKAIKASKGLQSGGPVGGLQPAKVESGELIFPPGSYGSEIPMLNENVPRFQGGGMTGSLGIAGSNLQNLIGKRFSNTNQTYNEMNNEQQQPIIVPVPMGNSDTSQGGSGFTNNTNIPQLSSSPSNHIVSSLMMSSYSLMQRIG